MSASTKVNINDIEWVESAHGNFSASRKSLSNQAGGQRLGASLYQLEPGKKAFPFHCHHANEEAILILSGRGSLRLGDETIVVKQNDYIALPAGIEHAHQVINSSDNILTYLCISTMIEPDVMEYPDSNKIGIMMGSAPGGTKVNKSQKHFFLKNDHVPYSKGE